MNGGNNNDNDDVCLTSENERIAHAKVARSPLDEGISWASIVTFWWINPLTALGRQRALVEGDIWNLPEADQPVNTAPRFYQIWDEERQHSESGEMPSLWRVLGRMYWQRIIVGGLFYVVSAACQISLPFLISEIIGFIEDSQDPTVEAKSTAYGMGVAVALLLVSVVSSLGINQMFYHMVRVGVSVRSLSMVVVYNKSLRLSALSKQSSSTGQTVNLMSADSTRLFEMIILLHLLYIPPIIIIVVLWLLYAELGPAAFAGMGLMLILVPVQHRIARLIGKHRRSMLQFTDDRVKTITEILNGIRVVKFYAWENPFADKVSALRAREVSALMYLHFMKAINLTLIFVWPSITALCMFALFVALGHEMTTRTIFSVLALMNVVRFPIALLPMSLAAFAEGRVSLERLQRFFALPELQSERSRLMGDSIVITTDGGASGSSTAPRSRASVIVDNMHRVKKTMQKMLPANVVDTGEVRVEEQERNEKADEEEVVIEVTDADFEWETGVSLLKNINLRVRKGALVGIVGSVGSGKSTLLSSMLGETHRTRGTVTINGRKVAYMSQENWIRNATVRENVLFGLPYDRKRYDDAIIASALGRDLRMLPNGDSTEIGERGINLSGGQKARVCLARAVYRSHLADIFILDDPFSAVDVNVGRHMFRHGILRALANKTRIVVLNSHLHFLKQFDYIYVIGTERNNIVEESDAVVAPRTIVGHGNYEDLEYDHADVLQSERRKETPSALSGGQRGQRLSTLGLDLAPLKRGLSSGSENDTTQTELSGVHSDSASMVAENTKPDKQKHLKPSASLIEEEDRETGGVSSEVWLKYLKSAQLFGVDTLKETLTLLVIIYLVANVLRVFSDYWLALWAEQSWNDDKPLSFWLSIYTAIVVGTTLATLVRSLVFVKVAVNASQVLHETLFLSLLRAPINLFFDVTPVGRIINRFSKDLDHVDILLPDFMAQLLQNSLTLFGALIVVCVATPWFALMLLPILYMFVKVQNYFRYTSREVKRLESMTRSPIFSSFSESLNGLSTIRAFKMQNAFEEHNMYLVGRNARVFFCFNFVSRWLAVRLDFLSSIVIGAVSVLAVALSEDVNASLVGLALIYGQQFTGLLQWTVRLWIETENNMTAVERLNHYANVPKEAPPLIENSVPDSWPKRGAITFKNLRLRYRQNLPLVLKGVTCDVKSQEKVGIVGRTGSGKSSLMIALFRVVESEEAGSIFIDGVDITTIGLHTLRSRMSIIPQDPVLFSGTCRYNLDPFGEQTDERVWQALDRVHLGDVVRGLDGQLDAHVAEYGENFSQGQRQLMCIARALLRNSKIIIMDEATASIDSATDQLIQATMRENFNHATVLTIAHRIDTIIDYDKVLVLKDGMAEEFDTPSNLYHENGIFGQMVRKAGLSINKEE